MYFTPPTDHDGGPMMAYNFLFFYPLSLISIFLSVIVIYRLKDFKDDLLSKIILIISIVPTILLTILITLNLYRVASEPKNFNIEVPNNEVNIIIKDSLKIELNGFTKIVLDNNGDYKNKKIINLLAYSKDKYKYKEGGKFTTISKNQKLIYKVKNDSLIIYKQDYEFSYFYDNRNGLPVKIEDIRNTNFSISELERMQFKTFYWN